MFWFFFKFILLLYIHENWRKIWNGRILTTKTGSWKSGLFPWRRNKIGFHIILFVDVSYCNCPINDCCYNWKEKQLGLKFLRTSNCYLLLLFDCWFGDRFRTSLFDHSFQKVSYKLYFILYIHSFCDGLASWIFI